MGEDLAGRRLDAVVAELPEVESRAEAQRLILAGRVTVDGAPARKRLLLGAGSELVVRPEPAAPGAPPAAEDLPVTVRYADAHLLVVDKPAGVATHPSRGHAAGTLVNALVGWAVAGGDDPSRPGIVHRLDKDTSGLLVVARSPRAHRRLARMLRDRAIDRRYLVLAHGHPPPALTVDRPVGRDRRARTRMSTRAPDGRPAVTHLRRLEELPAHSLLEARLETGRTHQIRVHLEAIGHPVAGDPVYGRRDDGLGLRRQFLHAARLSFAHPETGEPIAVESPLPPDLQEALVRARGWRDAR